MSTGKTPEKSNFSRRCSLLSRYLKEKGSFGNIDIGLSRKPDLGLAGKSDLELAGKSDLRGQQDVIKKAVTSETKPFELIPKLYVGEASGGKTKDAEDSEVANVVPDSGTSHQLTIFFDGKILVYNEFPQDKANEIMKVAKEVNHVAVDSENTQKNHMNFDLNIISSKSDVVIPDLNEPTNSGNNETGQQHQVVERIARRASLHRFFAKRKDRAVARAPYQVNQNGVHLPPKPKLVVPSVEPGQSSRQQATPPKPKRQIDMSMEVDEEERKCSKDLELKL